MINVLSNKTGTTKYISLCEGASSTYPMVGGVALAYQPSLQPSSSASYRSPLDYILTGPKLFAGDHECDHLQFSADVIGLPTAIAGLEAYDPFYGISASHVLRPSSDLGYSFSEIVDFFGGTGYSSEHFAKYRTSGSGLALSSFKYLPLCLDGSMFMRSYGAQCLAYYPYVFSIQEALSVTVSVQNRPYGSQAVYIVCAQRTRSYTALGIPSAPSFYVTCFAECVGPSTSGGTDRAIWYLNSTGVWTRSYSQCQRSTCLPNSLTSSQFDALLQDPSPIAVALPLGFASASGVPYWAPAFVPSYDGTITVGSTASSFDWESFSSAFSEKFRNVPSLCSAFIGDADWQDLGDTAADNTLTVAINAIAYVSDLKKVFSTIRQTLGLMTNWKNPTEWAKWWLSLRYGDRLTYLDTVSLVEGVSSEVKKAHSSWSKSFYKAYSQSSTTTTDPFPGSSLCQAAHHLKLYYKPKDYGWFGDAYRWACQWDVWPTLGNTWDLIPLSFVLDWFVNIGDVFEGIDRDIYMQYLQVLSVLTSSKSVFDLDDCVIDGLTVSSISVTHYVRSHSAYLPSALFRLERGHTTSINVIDGISLLVGNM